MTGNYIFIILMFALFSYGGGQDISTSRFNFSYGSDEFLAIYQEQKLPLTITVTDMDPAITTGFLQLRRADPEIFDVQGVTNVSIASLGNAPVNVSTSIKGLFFGISTLQIYYTGDAEDELVGSYVVKVSTIPTILTPVFSYLTLIWLIISYIMMGSKIKVGDIWSILKKPWVLLLAMVCQFFVMPALAFGLSKAFSLDNTAALGLIMVGSCPGGWLSNIFSLLLDCDFILSLIMTLSSTIVAMGMMPFNLWLYARTFTTGEENLETPYFDLFLQILYLIIPVGLSMIIARFSSKFTKYCEKCLKPVASMCIIVAISVGTPAQVHLYKSASIEEYAVSALLPLFGCIAGLIISKILCIKRKQAVTVSLETGSQNSLLAFTMLSLFYPRPEADLIGRVPYIIALLSLCEGIVVFIIYVLTRYVFCKERFAKKDNDSEEMSSMEKKLPEPAKNGNDVPLDMSEAIDPSSIVVGLDTNTEDQGHVNKAFNQ
ncbi:LOW QUALITY PROTEIN: sodium/bile acid cotransporter-like [Lytechinus variegatus]|uniref:LOW QUALITY PROTEIN: sodium/bile acid cotransporter-like n=1 Tax=Lytechinus variegatus TaxID=7654 RepID=UPI001BB16986|nr:LOW QUALITY PROTEIN: sodium/bile acid cotransporter-like [Lytechinus variegatus]